jgi:hypothetical protein
MKLDAETLRKLALAGARAELRDLETRVEKARDIVRQLSGAAIRAEEKPKPKPKVKKKRTRRVHTDAFKAKVVKEAREANNASAVGKKHELSPTLVRLWMDKAK